MPAITSKPNTKSALATAAAHSPAIPAGGPTEVVAETAAAPTPDRRKLARKVAGIVLGGFALILASHVLMDRLAPSSSTGSITAFTALVAPRVAGQVQAVYVSDNQSVKMGDPLFALDPAPFELTLRQAEANLALATQTVDASAASLIALQARVTQARGVVETAQAAAIRSRTLFERDLLSQVQRDAAESQLASAHAALDAAQADLDSNMMKAGGDTANHPQVLAAQVQLEQAQLNMSFATVLAPNDGVITNLRLAVGQYVNAGTGVLPFIENERPWIMVDLRENQLGNVEPGDPASVVFDAMPGRTFEARVQSIAWGIDPGRTSANGLPQNQMVTRWFEPARTVPVHIELAEGETWPANLRIGSKANALIYAGGTGNPAAWLAGALQAVQSTFSYLY